MTSPEWLVSQIILDYAKPETKNQKLSPLSEMVGGFSEASLRAPLNEEGTRMFRYCFTAVMKSRGIEVPGDLALETLSEYETSQLNRLRQQVYKKSPLRRLARGLK